MATLNFRFKTGAPEAYLTLSVSEEACADSWFDELPLFSYFTTAMTAMQDARSTEEAVMWQGHIERGLRVFFSGDAPSSREESLELDYWDIVDEEEPLPLDLDLLQLDGIQLTSNLI